MQPTRMTRYSITNDGMGPYATFSCDRCDREYRSTPSVTTQVTTTVTRSALGGFLRNIPLVGDAAANQVGNDRYRTTLSQQELATAWGQVAQYFRECPTCHEIVCVPDFDEVSGFCDDDSPRAAEVEAAKAQQAAAAMKSVADVFGISRAIQAGFAGAAATGSAPGAATAQTSGTASSVGSASAQSPTCGSCGASLPSAAKFCASCGTPVPQERTCGSCGTTLPPAARFCANCGTPAA
jgi:hypothetical protein